MSKSILVGILFFTALFVVGYFTIVTDGGPFKKSGGALKVYFPGADGIKTGNKVTVQGVPFGYVGNVRLVQVDENDNVIPEKLEIINVPGEKPKAVATKVELSLILKGPVTLFPNYTITIKNESLLSGRIVAIDPGTAEKKLTGKPIVIDDDETFQAVNFRGKVTQDPLVILSELIAENRGDIRSAVANLAEITDKINHGQGTLGQLVNNGDLHANVNTVLTDAQIVLREAREGLEDTREQAPVTSFIRSALSAF